MARNYIEDINCAECPYRIGSRRPSLASVHSTSSSIRSYSQIRFEKELQQKELRQEMKLRLTRLQQQQHYLQNKPHIIISDLHHGGAIPKTIAITTPSPITPSSTDELLPSVDEGQEVRWQISYAYLTNRINLCFRDLCSQCPVSVSIGATLGHAHLPALAYWIKYCKWVQCRRCFDR